jgi:hypothetical protein
MLDFDLSGEVAYEAARSVDKNVLCAIASGAKLFFDLLTRRMPRHGYCAKNGGNLR